MMFARVVSTRGPPMTVVRELPGGAPARLLPCEVPVLSCIACIGV